MTVEDKSPSEQQSAQPADKTQAVPAEKDEKPSKKSKKVKNKQQPSTIRLIGFTIFGAGLVGLVVGGRYFETNPAPSGSLQNLPPQYVAAIQKAESLLQQVQNEQVLTAKTYTELVKRVAQNYERLEELEARFDEFQQLLSAEPGGQGIDPDLLSGMVDEKMAGVTRRVADLNLRVAVEGLPANPAILQEERLVALKKLAEDANQQELVSLVEQLRATLHKLTLEEGQLRQSVNKLAAKAKVDAMEPVEQSALPESMRWLERWVRIRQEKKDEQKPLNKEHAALLDQLDDAVTKADWPRAYATWQKLPIGQRDEQLGPSLKALARMSELLSSIQQTSEQAL